MLSDFVEKTNIKMEKTIHIIKDEFTHIRTGRASSTLIDRLEVPYYGVLTPLKQVANISIPESNLIVIQPWDKSLLSEIEKTIWKADLGLTPSSDGNIIRLSIPPLNEERRKELVKLVKKLLAFFIDFCAYCKQFIWLSFLRKIHYFFYSKKRAKFF